MIFLEIFILIAFSIFSRIIFIIGNSSDDFWHINRIVSYKKNRYINFSTIVHNMNPKGEFVYPSLPHFIVSKFLKNDEEPSVKARLFNIAYDIINILLVFLFSYYCYANYLNIDNADIYAFVTSLLFSSHPLLFPVSARLKATGGRTLGLMLFNFYIVLFYMANYESMFFIYPLLVLVFILIILSSEFTYQMIVGLSVMLSIFLVSLKPIFIMIFAHLIALAFPSLGVDRILKNKLALYRRYAKYTKGTTVEGRNNIKDVLSIPSNIVEKKYGKIANIVFYKNSYIISLYSVATLYLLIYLSIRDFNEYSGYTDIHVSELLTYLVSLSVSMIIMFVFTSTKKFLFLGQAERYLEGLLLPISILWVIIVSKLYNDTMVIYYTFLLIIFNISVIFVMYIINNNVLFKERLRSSLSIEQIDILNKLKEIDEERHSIVTIPVKDAYAFNAYDDQNIYYLNALLTEHGYDYMADDQKVYDFINEDLDDFFRKYNIDILVINKKSLGQARKFGIIYSLDKYDLIYQNADYAVYKTAGIPQG